MTEQEFIEKWTSNWSSDRTLRFINDFRSTQLEQQSIVISNTYSHCYKCPDCDNYIFFNDDCVEEKDFGGGLQLPYIHCDCCRNDVKLYKWRII